MPPLVPQQNAFLKDVTILLQYAWSKGFVVTGGELYRTEDQQRIYYETGRSRTMSSRHRKRLAIDLNFFLEGHLSMDKDTLQILGDFWESLNDRNRWGGNWTSFVDTTHFERKPG